MKDDKYIPTPSYLMAPGDPIKYDSATTRYQSLDQFRGVVQLDDNKFDGPVVFPCDSMENLEVKFKSRTCRIDLPTRYNPPVVQRFLGEQKLDIQNDYDGFFRVGGMPVQKG